MLRRALEADNPKPEREEPGDHGVRGGETGGKESGGNCIPRGSLPTEGTGTTGPETRGPQGTRRERRRQRRKMYREGRAQTQEGSRRTPAAGGGPSDGETLKAQASTHGEDGARGEPVAPRPKGVSLPVDERRGRGLDGKGSPKRGIPPGHGPTPRPRPAFKAREGEDSRRDASYGPGEQGHGEARVSGNPRRRRGVSPPRAT